MKVFTLIRTYRLLLLVLCLLTAVVLLGRQGSTKLAVDINATEAITEETVQTLTSLLPAVTLEPSIEPQPQPQAVAATSTVQPVATSPAKKPATAAPATTAPPITTPPIVNWPLTTMFGVHTTCFEGVQNVYTDVIYTSTAANTAGVNLYYRLELVGNGVSLDGYFISQDFAEFVEPNKQHISAPAGYSFEYPVIPAGGSITVKLTTLQPFVAPNYRTIQNVCP
jgi:hypothetical protein